MKKWGIDRKVSAACVPKQLPEEHKKYGINIAQTLLDQFREIVGKWCQQLFHPWWLSYWWEQLSWCIDHGRWNVGAPLCTCNKVRLHDLEAPVIPSGKNIQSVSLSKQCHGYYSGTQNISFCWTFCLNDSVGMLPIDVKPCTDQEKLCTASNQDFWERMWLFNTITPVLQKRPWPCTWLL